MTAEAFTAGLAAWQNFYILSGTAAATLAGLMFVAVTFGAGLFTPETEAAARAWLDPPFYHFFHVLITAGLFMMPTMRPWALGAIVVALSIARAFTLARTYKRFRATSKGINGIDIVFDGRLGIELKLSAGTFDTGQLKRFCQWGAAKTLHTFFYAFVDFPDADPNDPNNFHRTAAKNCWDCWQGSGCGGPATSFGSIYVAFGAIKNKQGKRFFLPGSQTICGK